MELKSLASDGYMYVPQTQTGGMSTLFLPCIMKYAAKPSLGCRLPITIHPSNLIHAIQTHRSYPPYPISHSQGLRKRSLQNIHSLGRLPSHRHIVGRRMRGLDLDMLVGLQLGPKHWSALSQNSACCGPVSPLSILHFEPLI